MKTLNPYHFHFPFLRHFLPKLATDSELATMATQILSRVIPKTLTLTLTPFFSRSLSTSAPSSLSAISFLRRLRPLSVAASPSLRHFLLPATSCIRSFSTRATTSSLNDPNPNWSNRPPKETILLDGCDFEHWLVVMEKPEGDPTRDEIIDSYIKTLAKVIGSEEEARMKIYSVSTRHYFAFGALVSEELSYKIKELPGVRWVLPDSYLNVKEKDYGGEPFINGQAVPYDPKYHEEWVRNNARANERNRRNDRPRNADRSRNFERRRENVVNRDMQGRPPMPNPGPNMAGAPPGNAGGFPTNNAGGYAPPSNMSGPPSGNPGGYNPNNAGGYAPPNAGGYAPPNAGGYAPPNAAGGYPPPPPNMAGGYGHAGGMPQNNYAGSMGGEPPNQNMGGFQQNAGWSNNSPNRDMPNRDMGGAAGGNPYNA
ncbi:multiple organellar RNA editing factor 8, chloroplastic/mitochondrial-like isoform X2 [Abrus precatorius]|uniref:Multiple organellar RNA editing factor 8, chloroplastic/mitochondrial-like isoform X2 n=1 Tax=Abrus precatorius TaxID=3816 RepID=A0A8B8KF05_ABRPR|nr:multiple organellar RNA editing factor 8, chloroplastic/mitochondrial-like isoform X2 [Abrus precatorius]